MTLTIRRLVPALPPWLSRLMELRIDVSHDPKRFDEEIASIYDRIRKPGHSLHGIPEIPTDDPDLVFRYREADGEFYVYVEDIRREQLVGYTVFNRLIEVSKRADRFVRAPHSKYDPQYQRRGLATAIYRWGLDAGLCLMTGARQSTGAHALWHALARRYELGYVDLRSKTLTYLGREVSPQVLDDLHTRMILLGDGWTVDRFAKATGMNLPPACAWASRPLTA
ncbi:N-acetyltransferase [Variovorax ureilyticus]|uniref:N-acetyltransferase n=1 Tax=Variovorax ureilyticus TaxID=1836198 RepID=UPI003D679B93